MAKKDEVKQSEEVKEEVRIEVIEVKEIEHEGKKFNAYKTVAKNGKKLDLRFVRGCNNIPTEPCTIVVKSENANVDTTRRFPILWVKDVEAIEETVHKTNIADYFD